MTQPAAPSSSSDQQRAKLIAQGVGIFLVIAVALGISQFQLGAHLVWGGLVIVILVMALHGQDKIIGLLNTLEGK